MESRTGDAQVVQMNLEKEVLHDEGNHIISPKE